MITSEIIPPSPHNWDKYGKDIFPIEQKVFAEKSFDEAMMKTDINDPKAVLTLLKDESVVIGFAYALPEDESVSCIVDIVIINEYQNKGLVAELMHTMEAELRKQDYEFMVEHAMVDNGYADKIEKNYQPRIVERKDFVGEYGRQRYFKIRL